MSYFPIGALIYINGTRIYQIVNKHTPGNYSVVTLIIKKILSLAWNKITDKINIEILQFSERQITKRNIISYIAYIYDPLGLISASHIIGKLIYRELYDLKIPWDEETPDILIFKFKKWVQDISSNKIALPRAIPLKLEPVTAIDLQVFGDASIVVNCATV